MTEDRIKQLQDLLAERAKLQREKDDYDEILKHDRKDVGIEVFASGWHSANRICLIHEPLPEKIWEALEDVRQIKVRHLLNIEKKIAEF